MVNDILGISEIYTDNLFNPQNIFIDKPEMTHYYKLAGDLANIHLHEDGMACTNGNKSAKFYIYSSSGYNYGLINKNLKQNLVNLFMQDTKDWFNVEISLYIKLVNSLSNDVFCIKARGGEHDGVRNNIGTGLGVELGYDGKIRFVKELRHNDYITYSDWLADIGDIQNRWIGLKLIIYNDEENKNVKLECHVDTTNLNAWEKVCEIIDDGSGIFGGKGILSNGELINKVLWGGPVITLEWNNVADPDGIIIKNLSNREINPNKKSRLKEMSTVATTIAEERGKRLYSGSIGSPLLISGTSPATVNNYGVENRYGTGRILYS